jgi:hypothetical protein
MMKRNKPADTFAVKVLPHNIITIVTVKEIGEDFVVLTFNNPSARLVIDFNRDVRIGIGDTVTITTG